MKRNINRVREQIKEDKKNLLMAVICLVLLFLVSCTADSLTVNDYFFPYSNLEVFEGTFSQVTFTSSEMVYPDSYTKNGKTYKVAVINGFENAEDALSLTGTLEIKDGIMAINSGAFLRADNVREVILPVTCRSLGTNSIPQKASTMTMPLKAASNLNKAISDENKENLKTLIVIGRDFVTITGNFFNLESITVQGINEGDELYWPNLPTLEKEGCSFGGWVDSDGNKIYGGTRITSTTSVAKPIWGGGPTPNPNTTPGGSGMGFVIPYLGLATEQKYELEFTDNKDGTYSFKPASESADYGVEFDNKEFTGSLDKKTKTWIVSVTSLGKHTFRVFYLDSNGKTVGFGQITWTATKTT